LSHSKTTIQTRQPPKNKSHPEKTGKYKLIHRLLTHC